jgi:hypothetical protein
LAGVIEKFGVGRVEAQAYANKLLGLPKNVKTKADLDTASATAKAKAMQEKINGLHGKKIPQEYDPVPALIKAGSFQAAMNALHGKKVRAEVDDSPGRSTAASFQRTVNALHGKAVTIRADASTESANSTLWSLWNAWNNRTLRWRTEIADAKAGGGPIGYAGGGSVSGPGTGTSDSIPADGPLGRSRYRLSNGEHIIAAAEVAAAGGHNAMFRLRKALLRHEVSFDMGGGVVDGRAFRGLKYGLESGPVDRPADPPVVVQVFNPRPERASDSVQDRLTRMSQLGLIGGRRSDTNG